MAEIAPGTLIDGRYRVISRLGSGGMADVFCAEDQQLGRKVAVKLLHRRFAEDPGFVERFRREAQAAAGLQHPNVVSVYDRGAYDGTYYIAMEYLPGRTLKALIRDEAPVNPIRAIDITLEILKAARFAHRRGVIHRDLKPHNVIIDETDHAKVTDFGIARAGASDMTETGSIMGTAQYLSPEQAQGHAVSATSDLYSVGVVLYELLTAKVPFDAEAAVTIALKHVSEAPVPPSAINPSVPPELEQVVLWALEKDPARRPADADQLITALESVRAAILSGGRGERTASMAALALAGGAGEVPPTAPTQLADPAAVHGVESEDGAHGPPPEEPPPEARRRRRRWPWVVLALLVLAGAATAAFLLTRTEQKVVPNVVGQTLTVAETQITNAGFVPNKIDVADGHPSGTVISQSPPAGTKTDKGSTVTIKVSQGPGNVAVPSVAGLSSQQAKDAIRASGLKVARVVLRSSDTAASGDAIGTEPPAGQQLAPGTPVTLFVSSGQTSATVPDVTGQSQAAASSTLQSAGFSVSSVTQSSSSTPAGNVISQSPAGGSKAKPGTTVTITVASAPTTPTANVPDVKGQTAGAAASALRAAGFSVTQTRKNVTNPAQANVVLDQSPAGGSQANKGSTVTITVGRFKASPTPTPTTTTTTGK